MAYEVVVDGTLLPGHNTEQATVALVQRFGLPEATAADLLRGGREVVKKDLDQAKSQTYVDALRRCGVVARAERMPNAPQRGRGADGPALAVDFDAAYALPKPAAPRPPPPSHPIERMEPAPRGSSLGVVSWAYLIAVPVTLLLLAFGDALGSVTTAIVILAAIMQFVCFVWMLSAIAEVGGGLWAVAALFFWPAYFLFVVMRWHAARAPFLTSLAAGLVFLSGLSSMSYEDEVECGSRGSFSYDDGEECACEVGYDWCGTDENDMSCCPM